MEFALVAIDGAGRQVETERFSSLAFEKGEWHQVSTVIGSSFPNGFNGADVRRLGIHFYAGSSLPYGYINLDTIRITE